MIEKQYALWDCRSYIKPQKPIDTLLDFDYVFDSGNRILEKKSDGFGILVSIDSDSAEPVKFFSLGGNRWNPDCFPEIDFNSMPDGFYHGEIRGKKNKEDFTCLDEFSAIQNRPKIQSKNVTCDLVERNPLRLDLFDILAYKSGICVDKPLYERKELLEKIIEDTDHIGPIQRWYAGNSLAIETIYHKAIDIGYEGLIAKKIDSCYSPGKKNTDWMKLKNFYTVDLAVMGLYQTDASIKTGKPFSAVLGCTYNQETGRFETIAKVKIGKKKDCELIMDVVKNNVVLAEGYSDVIATSQYVDINPEMQKTGKKIPDKVISYDSHENLAVVEIQTQGVTNSKNWHSCGYDPQSKKSYSLRIPSFKKLRVDKTKISDITTTDEIIRMYG